MILGANAWSSSTCPDWQNRSGDHAKGMANAGDWFDTGTAQSFDPATQGFIPR
ncbi:MAG: hypothetical protein JWR00_4375 [Rubritepida sp.]|nr:hypothetical protein [Rubritepida sp.]